MHAVIFDIDGTLLQSAAVDDLLYEKAVQAVLGPVKIRTSLLEYDHVSDSGILAQVFADNALPEDPSVAAAIKTEFVAALAKHVSEYGPFTEFPGARNALETLNASADHCVAIATGGWRESAILKLQTAGFAEFGLPMATSDDARDRKDIMSIALSRLGNDFGSVTYYGDGPWDRDASQALGWQFVAVGSMLDGIESYDQMTFS